MRSLHRVRAYHIQAKQKREQNMVIYLKMQVQIELRVGNVVVSEGKVGVVATAVVGFKGCVAVFMYPSL